MKKDTESRNRMVIKPYRMINSLINYCSQDCDAGSFLILDLQGFEEFGNLTIT